MVKTGVFIRKKRERNKARKLRKKGKGIKEIAKLLHVSPGSVHKWCQDIKLTPLQRKQLDQKSLKALQEGRKIAAQKQRDRRLTEIKKLRAKGVRAVGKLNKK